MSDIPGIGEPYSHQIQKLLQGVPPTTEALLFGSRAKGNYREGSDIDIALKGRHATLDLRDELLNAYEELNLPWKLDLVIYEQIQEPALKEHIDRVGRRLFPPLK